MKYDFNTQKGSFYLYDPETGKGWDNIIFNDLSYICSIGHLGYSTSRYLNKDCVNISLSGGLSAIYIRDKVSNDYWSIGPYPTFKPIENYCCEHSQNYSKISSSYNGIKGEAVYTIHPTDTCEVWKVTLTNTTNSERVISVVPYTMFSLEGFAQPFYYNMPTTSATEYVPEANGIYCQNKNPYRPHEICSGYLVSSQPVAAYCGNPEKFIGTTYSHVNPKILELGQDLPNVNATVRCRGAILQNDFTIPAGESVTVYYAHGLTDDKAKLCKGEGVLHSELEAIVNERLSAPSPFNSLSVECPEPQINRVLNHWAEHQIRNCMIGKKAVRDNAQLAMAILNCDPKSAGEVIEECIVHQYSDGHAVLLWYPVVDSHIYSDPSTWLTFAICEYIKETGDLEYLNKKFAWLDGGEGTVWEHLKAAVEWFSREDNKGPHSIPKIHFADWNDALNIPDENGESVLMSMLIGKAYVEIEHLARYIGDNEYADKVHALYEDLKAVTNEVAFNGDYYVRAFSKAGVVGDKDAENGGKIYVNPQSWSILSGICPPERLDKVLASVAEMETEEGVPLCSPAYSTYDPNVGRMSGMLPGVYENGGIYNHAGCFKVMSDCKLGRGEEAVATLLKIIPDGKANPSSLTTCEPYVFTNCYLKHETMDMMVGFAWQTGTSAWGLMCCYEGILGLNRDYDGLHINPAFPKSWKNVSATRIFRGNKLNIKYINNGGKNVTLKVDGKAIAGNVVPAFADNDDHNIEVTIG